MEKTLKNFIYLFNNIINTFFSLIKIIIKSRLKIAKIPAINSSTCIVLGNGPSLKDSFEEHMDFIKSHPLICVNGFVMSKEYSILKPTNYILIDSGFWIGNNDVTNNILTAIIKDTTWDLNLFVPYDAHNAEKINSMPQKNKHIKINYINYVVFRGFKKIAHLFFLRNIAMPQCQNVVVAALFIAINSGVKEIYLLGGDHTWHQNLIVNNKNEVCLKDEHFYDDKKVIGLRKLYKSAYSNEVSTMEETFISLAKAFTGYTSLKYYAQSKKVKIFNASKISFIDVFERKQL